MNSEQLKDYRHGHRARLREKFLAGHLADYEKLELLLSYAIPRVDVKPIARELLNRFNCVNGVLTAPISELKRIPGIAENTAIFIKVMHEITLMDYKSTLSQKPVFLDYKAFENYCRLTLAQKDIEEMHVLYLDKQHKLIEDEIHSRGTTDHAVVYPLEIARRAVALGAKSVVLMHNHPGEMNSFSSADIRVTHEVIAKLAALDIRFFDHLLVSGNIIYSMRNLHFLK